MHEEGRGIDLIEIDTLEGGSFGGKSEQINMCLLKGGRWSYYQDTDSGVLHTSTLKTMKN